MTEREGKNQGEGNKEADRKFREAQTKFVKSDEGKRKIAQAGNVPAVAYLGDDLTDEDAFRAIKGVGLGGLVRAEFRPTAADIWLLPPEELIDFLRQWHYAALRR